MHLALQELVVLSAVMMAVHQEAVASAVEAVRGQQLQPRKVLISTGAAALIIMAAAVTYVLSMPLPWSLHDVS